MNPDKIYFTSDTHFGHEAMMRPEFCNRPGVNRDEMDDFIIDAWNETVPDDGHIYILGDFSFRNREETEDIIEQLNGYKYLIEGNHDARMARSTKDMFEWSKPYHELRALWDGGKLRICLGHYAMRHWNQGHYGSWNLHGHSHGSLPPNGRQLDVGVDTNGMKPYTFYDVAKIMEKREPWQPDHHKNWNSY
jgi:calcineurin-like phosphoesterase family protein